MFGGRRPFADDEKLNSEILGSGDLLSVEDVAERLGVGRVTVYRWCREGRLPCLKVGRAWRVRRESLEDFLRRSELPTTLAGQLRSFVRIPDTIIGIAQTKELLHRLDAAFFRVAESRGGLMVKYHAGEPEQTEDDLREILSRHGLEVRRLEREGRFRFSEERDPASGRTEALEWFISEQSDTGRSTWAAFNWTTDVDVETALRQQESLSELANRQQVVVKTAVLEAVADEWSRETRRLAETVHSGTIWLFDKNVSFSRVAPLPKE
jgi:excisionase family DNA binding protein